MNKILLPIALISILTSSCSKNDANVIYEDLPDLTERQLAGGGTTVFSDNSTAFSTVAPNATGTDFTNHAFGDAQFEQAFVTAPSIVNAGLGTIFNNTSCVSCHIKDGRSAFPGTVHPYVRRRAGTSGIGRVGRCAVGRPRDLCAAARQEAGGAFVAVGR